MRTAIKLLVWTILLLALFIAIGALYNYIAVRHAQGQNPPPGELYSIDGYQMHLYCSGSGAPTVVLDGGLGSTWISWQLVQPELAKQTRVCSYDRAGLGWSDPRPGARDSEAVATQLHELLSAAGISGPLILVGQSAGGLYVRKYAAKYPRDVAGLVLVDGTMPDLFSRLPGERETAAQIAERHHQAWIYAAKVGIGLARLQGRCQTSLTARLGAYARYSQSEQCRPAYELSWLGERDDMEKSAEEVLGISFGDLPLAVVSQDPDRPKPGWSATEIAANPVWAAMQEDQKKLSHRSYRVIARGAGHQVQIDRPDIVNAAVTQMILELRGQTTDRTKYGDTIVQ